MADRPLHMRQADSPEREPEIRAQRIANPDLWEWEAAYGKAALRGRGMLLTIAIFGLLIVGTNAYFGWRVEQSVRSTLRAAGQEHREIVRGAEQTTCILALTPEERLRFREDARPDAWARWCWWLQRPDRFGGP